jgi:Protein of unknown function (DUF1203)
MDFRITGLPLEPFIPFFAMSDEELLCYGARRVVAKAEDAPLMQPCRVSLRDSEPGEVSILLNYAHHVAATSPYRASGPIFVRRVCGRRQASSIRCRSSNAPACCRCAPMMQTAS